LAYRIVVGAADVPKAAIAAKQRVISMLPIVSRLLPIFPASKLRILGTVLHE
jgi:hypothetical protein